MDTEDKLILSTKDQEQKLKAAEDSLTEVQNRFEEAERDVGIGDVHSQIQKLESQVQHYQTICQTQLPQSIDGIRQQIDTLRKIKYLTSVTEAFNTLENDIRRLKEEISTLQDKLNEQSQSEPSQEDQKMASFTKMMETRKKDLSKKLDLYMKEARKLDDKKKELEDELKEFDGKKIPTKEEFEQYKVEIMHTATKCRAMKQDLATIKDETSILKRTEDILKSRNQKIEEFLQELESKHGVQGFREIQKNLEHVSIMKGNIDEIKGATLEQISKVVQQINDEINAKKNQYKPKVQKLREARQEMQNLEQEYSEKKAIYENTKSGFESERNRLLDEMGEYQHELEQSESVYHLLNAQILINKNAKTRVDNEKEFREGTKRLNATYNSYQSMLTAELSKLEEESKHLREKQRDIKENYDPAQKQISWFTNLKKMLDCKLQLKDQYSTTDKTRTSLTVDTRSFMTPQMSRGMSRGGGSSLGVDRLVIEQ
jgi:intraflagellar transport protein 81